MRVRRRTGNRRVRRRPPLGVRLAARLVPLARVARRGLLPALVLGVLVAGATAAFRYVATGPYFRLRHVEVSGLSRVDEAELLVRAHLTMGVTDTLELDEDLVRESLERHPWIASARVRKQLPDRLRIAVTERRAVAVVLLDRPVLADPFATLFALPTRPADHDLPVVTGLRAAALRAGDEVESRRLKTALAAAREWRRQGLHEVEALSEVRPDPVMGLTLVTADNGTEVRLGHGELAGRIGRLKRVLQGVAERGRRAAYVLLDDERDPGRAAVREAPAPRQATITRRSDGTQG